MTTLRRALAIVSLWVPAGGVLLTRLLWSPYLSQALPTHWGVSGPADAATDTQTFFAWCLGIALAAAVTGTLLLLLRLPGRWTPRSIAVALGLVAAFSAAMWTMSAVPSLGVADPYTVELGPWSFVAWVAPAYALVPMFLLPPAGAPPVPVTGAVPLPRLEHGPGQVVVWSRTITSGLFVVVSVMMLLLGFAILIPVLSAAGAGDPGVLWGLIPYAASVLLVLVFCAFRVTVDWRGLRVTSVVLGIPLKRIAPEDIAAVDAAVLEPTQWGGWGYRILPGRSAIILRRGPGLIVTTRSDTQFAITLARPEEPASLLASLLTRGEGAG